MSGIFTNYKDTRSKYRLDAPEGHAFDQSIPDYLGEYKGMTPAEGAGKAMTDLGEAAVEAGKGVYKGLISKPNEWYKGIIYGEGNPSGSERLLGSTPEAGEVATPEVGEVAMPEVGEVAMPEVGKVATPEAGKVAAEPGKTQTAATPEAGPVFKGGRLTGVPETTEGTAALQNSMQPYSRSQKPGDVGKPTNTLGINNGFGGQGTIQWADNRKLSDAQMKNLTQTIQSDSDPLAQQKRKESAALANQNLARAGGNNQQSPIQQVVMPGGGEEIQDNPDLDQAYALMDKKESGTDFFGDKALRRNKAAAAEYIKIANADAEAKRQGVLARQNAATGYQQYLNTSAATQAQNAAQNALEEKKIEATERGTTATRDLAEQNAASTGAYREAGLNLRRQDMEQRAEMNRKKPQERMLPGGEIHKGTFAQYEKEYRDKSYGQKFNELYPEKPSILGQSKGDIEKNKDAFVQNAETKRKSVERALASGKYNTDEKQQLMSAFEEETGSPYEIPE